MSMITPRARVEGLGSAKDGTGHWWAQRLTAIALVPLIVAFLIPFIGALGAGREAVVAAYQVPFNAITAILFLGVMFHHLQLGLQVVIEDYVHGAMRAVLLIGNILFCWLMAGAGIFAIARMAFFTVQGV